MPLSLCKQTSSIAAFRHALNSAHTQDNFSIRSPQSRGGDWTFIIFCLWLLNQDSSSTKQQLGSDCWLTCGVNGPYASFSFRLNWKRESVSNTIIKPDKNLKLTCLGIVDIIFIGKDLIKHNCSWVSHWTSQCGREGEAWHVGIRPCKT